eukprot:2813029-Rhodomonas_salina.1
MSVPHIPSSVQHILHTLILLRTLHYAILVPVSALPRTSPTERREPGSTVQSKRISTGHGIAVLDIAHQPRSTIRSLSTACTQSSHRASKARVG